MEIGRIEPYKGFVDMCCIVPDISRKLITEGGQQNAVRNFRHKSVTFSQAVGDKFFARIKNAVRLVYNALTAFSESLGKVIGKILIGQAADKAQLFKSGEILFQAEHRFTRPQRHTGVAAAHKGRKSACVKTGDIPKQLHLQKGGPDLGFP